MLLTCGLTCSRRLLGLTIGDVRQPHQQLASVGWTERAATNKCRSPDASFPVVTYHQQLPRLAEPSTLPHTMIVVRTFASTN